MWISTLFIILNISFAQSSIEDRVNDHLIETSKKIEINRDQKEVELQKDVPDYMEYNPPTAKKSAPFVVEPPHAPKDNSIYRDQFDPSTDNDPALQVQQDMLNQRALANEHNQQGDANAEFIRQFKENAAKAGVKVHIDPNTLNAQPAR